MVEGILLDWIGGRLLDWLPRWILRRFVKLESIARQVKLLPRSKSPVAFNLNASVPDVYVWFQVENHSGLDVILDRVAVEVWAGQPVAYGVLAYRTAIPRHTTEGQIVPFKSTLTPAAVELIKKQQEMKAPYGINGDAFFDSKLGAFSVRLSGPEGMVPVS